MLNPISKITVGKHLDTGYGHCTDTQCRNHGNGPVHGAWQHHHDAVARMDAEFLQDPCQTRRCIGNVTVSVSLRLASRVRAYERRSVRCRRLPIDNINGKIKVRWQIPAKVPVEVCVALQSLFLCGHRVPPPPRTGLHEDVASVAKIGREAATKGSLHGVKKHFEQVLNAVLAGAAVFTQPQPTEDATLSIQARRSGPKRAPQHGLRRANSLQLEVFYQQQPTTMSAPNTVNTELTVRPVVPADVNALLELRTSVRENHMSEARLAQIGITRASLARMLGDGNLVGWCAEQASVFAGFVLIRPDARQVFALFVAQSHAGLGVGSRLLELAVTHLRTQEASPIRLTTGPGTVAHGFYLRRGWREVGFAPDCDDVILEYD